MLRPIDEAMAEERPDKQTVRAIWLERAIEVDQEAEDEEVPLYLTLAGSEAYDIALLIEHQIVKLTEIGGIAEESKGKIVAVERNAQAVFQLQRKYPNLKIIEKDITEMLRGNSLLTFPDRNSEERKYFRARIINLDFDIALNIRRMGGGGRFSNFEMDSEDIPYSNTSSYI